MRINMIYIKFYTTIGILVLLCSCTLDKSACNDSDALNLYENKSPEEVKKEYYDFITKRDMGIVGDLYNDLSVRAEEINSPSDGENIIEKYFDEQLFEKFRKISTDRWDLKWYAIIRRLLMLADNNLLNKTTLHKCLFKYAPSLAEHYITLPYAAIYIKNNTTGKKYWIIYRAWGYYEADGYESLMFRNDIAVDETSLEEIGRKYTTD